MIAAVDYSVSFRYIALVAANEHRLKKSSFLSMTRWLKHVADLPKREKIAYLHRLPERLLRVSSTLTYIRIFNNVDQCNSFIERINPIIVIVDNRLYPHITHPRKVLESRVRETHRRKLMMLADNVAYFAYWATEIRKRPELLQQVLK